MLTTNLFDHVLIKPAKEGADTLYIFSGFASAALAANQFEELKSLKQFPKVMLLIGMYANTSNLWNNHIAFKALSSDEYPTIFECFYVAKPPQVHAKGYSWYKNGLPYRGFLGSANYTKQGFGNSQREAMTECSADEIKEYFDALLKEAVDCRDAEAEELVKAALLKQQQRAKKQAETIDAVVAVEQSTSNTAEKYEGLEHVCISFLAAGGRLPQRSGLNWGQRTGRDPNQSYLRVPSAIYSTSFFPPRKETFTVIADDDKSIICVRAQDNGKALHSVPSNSHLGQYFRGRLGLSAGARVDKADLLRYGRTNVDFYKIDDETYLMDFAPPASAPNG